MSEPENLEVISTVYAAFGRGDLEGILARLDPQVSWRTPGPPDLPTAGLRHGVAAVREFFGLLLNTLDIQDFRAVDFRWVHVFKLRNGKIVEFEEPADVSALVEEFRQAQATA